MVTKETRDKMSAWADRRAEEVVFDSVAMAAWRELTLADRLLGVEMFAHMGGDAKMESAARSMRESLN